MKASIEKLTLKEKETLYNSPIYVALLIAFADEEMDEREKSEIFKLIHIKTFSEKNDTVKEIYNFIDKDLLVRFDSVFHSLPSNSIQRNIFITEKIAALNPILNSFDIHSAINFYNSLKNFAVHVANVSGGIWGVHQISDKEKSILNLSMLENPYKES
jgi:hypothetical protein